MKHWRAVASVALVTAASVGAQSLPPGFDSSKPVRVTGTITRTEWNNPLAWVHVSSSGGDTYVIALASPKAVERLGFKRDSFKDGERVTIDGYLALDGARRAIASVMTTADGRTLYDRGTLAWAASGADAPVKPDPR
jgi:hypothetical protein